MRNTLLIILTFIFSYSGIAQIPPGYYDGTENLTGTDLLDQLHGIIDNHTSVSYTALWTHVQSSDKKSNGKVWDMYSDVPGGTPPYEFTFVSDQCGNYGGEGDCYNREHSFPQSWFNSGSPMKTDMFHVYPTDGYVNGQRGNYPFGETNSATWTSQNGSKKGPCSYPGNTGIIFEPIDEYKGDFARTYFYMSARYRGETSGWANNEMVDGVVIKEWARNMLIEWHVDDPVSTKETNRNNVVYGIQHNRNPFIDHPEFAHLIFADDYPQPTFGAYPSDTVTQGNQYLYEIPFGDAMGNEIFFTEENLPTWLTLNTSISSVAKFEGTPDINDVGVHEVSIIATNLYSEPVVYTFSVEVLPLTAINSMLSGNSEIILYPNPCDDMVYLKSESTISLVSLFSIDGRVVRTYNLSNSENKIDLNFLERGFYNLVIIDEFEKTSTISLIKN